MIERVILNILKENGFNKYIKIEDDSIKNLVFAYRENDVKSEFYIVGTIEQNLFMKLEENKVFSSLSKKIKESSAYKAEVDKNTSLVLCIFKNKSEKSYESIEKKELQLEENPYFFKKYMLSVDENLVEEVFGQILECYSEKTSISKYIENEIINTENFKNYKLNPENEEKYELFSRIVMKIPVMSIKVPDNKSIKPLENMINDEIIKEDLQKVQKLIAYISEENDKKIEPDNKVSQIIDFWSRS